MKLKKQRFYVGVCVIRLTKIFSLLALILNLWVLEFVAHIKSGCENLKKKILEATRTAQQVGLALTN